MKEYVTIEPYTCETEIKRSRFITEARRVRSEDELFSELCALRKKYSDATHVCYAAVFDTAGNAARFSDDGEPSGTAGQPILEAIKATGLRETLVAVVRYFGGIKLGAGGLTRAYAGCAAAVKNAPKILCEPCDEYELRASFALAKRLPRALAAKGYEVKNTRYDEAVTFTILSKAGADAESEIAEIVGGVPDLKKLGSGYYEKQIF